MKKRICGICLGLVMLVVLAGTGHADFGHAGVMVTPGFLKLAPQSSLARCAYLYSRNYTFSCAPLFFKPDEREETEAHGPAATDPEAETTAVRLKLPGASIYEMEWYNGWNPETVTVQSWDPAVYTDPDRKDEYALGSPVTEYDRIILEPDRVYQFTAEWTQDSADDEFGAADYLLITEQMTEDEIAEARAREAGPYTEEDMEYITMKLNGVDYILGSSTPQDLIDHGWVFSESGDVMVFQDEEGYSDVYTTTAHNQLDEPMISLDAMWAYETRVEYRGLSWHTGEEDDWDDDNWDEDLDDDDDDDELYEDEFPTEASVEGIYTSWIPLSTGGEVEIVDHGSPYRITLLATRAFTPLSFSFWDIDREGGTYDLGITDTDRIDSDGFFYAQIYQPDLYPAGCFSVLRPGDRIRLNGRNMKIVSIEAREEGDWEIGVEDPEREGETAYYMFLKKDREGTLYYAVAPGDWVPTTFLVNTKVTLPLPENFRYVQISAGEEVTHPTEELIELLRNGELQGWSPYNTSITFKNGAPAEILHSGYPSGPDT